MSAEAIKIDEPAIEEAPKKRTNKYQIGYDVDLNESNDPSYTNLVLPYRVICRQRYKRNEAKMRNQFIREIREHELLQAFALNGVRVHRIFCDPVLERPDPSEFVQISIKDQYKIEELLKN